jgi:hypothetical protein
LGVKGKLPVGKPDAVVNMPEKEQKSNSKKRR